MIIAICDDESLFVQELRAQILEYTKEKRIAADIHEFADGKALLESDKLFDIIFLDYKLPDMNGLDAARQLRKKRCTSSIIFVTAFPQFVYDSFEVQPFRFFVKPLEKDKLRAALDNYISQRSLFNSLVVIRDGEQITIDSRDVIYLEGDGKYCLVRTKDDSFRSSKTLSQVQELLPEHCFYRIHKSYVVNMYCISSINGSELILTNGERAAIGRTRLASFRKSYMDFIKHYYVRL